MAETLTREEQRELEKQEILSNLKPLSKQLNKTDLHINFGICFDKKDTYTVKELNVEELKNVVTIHKVLLATDTTLAEDKQTVIVYRYVDNDWYKTQLRTVSFQVTMDKKVGTLFSCYRACSNKGDILPFMKKAVQIVVIQADNNSLKFPKDTSNFRLSTQFNDDSTLYNRVKFTKNNYYTTYSEELKDKIRVQYTYDELMSQNASTLHEVMILNTDIKFDLYKTIGNLYDTELWSDLLDKSGYNLNIARINLGWRLESFKANKIKEKIKSGDITILTTDVITEFAKCKRELSNFILICGLDTVQKAFNFTSELNRLVRGFDSVKENINNAGTTKEYLPYTLSIVDDLKELQKNLIDLQELIKKEV